MIYTARAGIHYNLPEKTLHNLKYVVVSLVVIVGAVWIVGGEQAGEKGNQTTGNLSASSSSKNNPAGSSRTSTPSTPSALSGSASTPSGSSGGAVWNGSTSSAVGASSSTNRFPSAIIPASEPRESSASSSPAIGGMGGGGDAPPIIHSSPILGPIEPVFVQLFSP